MQNNSSSTTKVLALTGGGTAGHVMAHIALLSELKKRNFKPIYIGGNGVEKSIAQEYKIPFFEIKTGKLRRYFSWQNFIDPFKVIWGFFEALRILSKQKVDVVFSKGGFVSVPVCLAAWFLRIPVVTHESDYTPGLANKIIARISKVILFAFPETEVYLKNISAKKRCVGLPVREDLKEGDKQKGLSFCGWSESNLPVILVMGGSQGAQRINDNLLAILPELCESSRVIHLTGKGKAMPFKHENYRQFEFISRELKDLLALSDIVVSRAGANSIFELLFINKPMLLIPLEIASRGDQVLNAKSFEKKGWALSLSERTLSPKGLKEGILACLGERSSSLKLQQQAAKVFAACEMTVDEIFLACKK